MPWYSKSISLFPPADCYIISSNLSYTVEIAPAVTSLVLVVLCFKPFRKLPLYFNDVKIIPLAIIQAEFLEENTIFIKGLTPAVLTNTTSFHLTLRGEIIVNRSCFHQYKIIYKLLTKEKCQASSWAYCFSNNNTQSIIWLHTKHYLGIHFNLWSHFSEEYSRRF